MKEYLKITIPAAEKETQEILIALLAEENFDSFEESDATLTAFIQESDFKEEVLNEILQPFSLSFSTEKMESRNWNAVWESGFEPVVIENYVAVRADFHKPVNGVQYEIVITPKMSFGTGHHATTHLMLAAMKKMDFAEKTVIDFGTGTGILAIMAEKLGASKIEAIDIDEWSIENTKENLQKNDCHKVHVSQGENLNDLGIADIILANINRHILLEHMPSIRTHLKKSGVVLLSGLLKEDEEIIAKSIVGAGLTKGEVAVLGDWISIICTV